VAVLLANVQDREEAVVCRSGLCSPTTTVFAYRFSNFQITNMIPSASVAIPSTGGSGVV